MKIEIVDLDVKQILLCVQPVVATAERRGQLSAVPGGTELLTARNGRKAAFR